MDKRYCNDGSLIVRTMEECSEVIHILCKIERFGMYCYNPYDETKTPNYSLAISEIKDLERCLKGMKRALKIAKDKEEGV